MMLRNFKAFIAAVVLFPVMAAAVDEIDVLLVFSNDSGLSLVEKIAKGAEYQLALNAAVAPIPGDRKVNVIPNLATEMAYSLGEHTSSQGAKWLKDEDNKIVSIVKSYRNSAGGNGGADLVMMVGPKFTNASCGSGDTTGIGNGSIPLEVSVHLSEDYAAFLHPRQCKNLSSFERRWIRSSGCSNAKPRFLSLRASVEHSLNCSV